MDLGKCKLDMVEFGPQEQPTHLSFGVKKSKTNVSILDSNDFTSYLTDMKGLANDTVAFISTAAKWHTDREL